MITATMLGMKTATVTIVAVASTGNGSLQQSVGQDWQFSPIFAVHSPSPHTARTKNNSFGYLRHGCGIFMYQF